MRWRLAGHTKVWPADRFFSGFGLVDADVQHEVPEPQVKQPAAGPVDDECQKDDGEDDYHQPDEEHDNSGECVPGYCSGSNHSPQLPEKSGLTP